MSFLSILKTIVGIGERAEHVAAPLLELAFPQFAAPVAALDNFVLKLHSSVLTTEFNNPVDGQGNVKAPAALADVQSYFDTMNAGLALAGKQVSDDPAARKAALDATVAAYNAAAAWKKTFQVVDIPKTA